MAKISEETKEQCLMYVSQGYSIQEISMMMGVSRPTLYRWKKAQTVWQKIRRWWEQQ